MKSFITSIIILVISLLITIVGSSVTDNALANIEEVALAELAEYGESTAEYAAALESAYLRDRGALCIIVSDRELRVIEGYISDVKAAAELESEEELIIAKSRLSSQVKQLRRLYTLRVEAIL